MTPRPFLGYYWGDDAYALEDAARSLAAQMAAAAGAPPLRWSCQGADVVADLGPLEERLLAGPLFGPGTLVVLLDPAPIVRSRRAVDRLARVLDAMAPGNGLAILDLAPEGGRSVGPAVALRQLVDSRGGEVRELRAPRPGDLVGWIAARAAERGLRLTPQAARELARRVGGLVREGDVDRRHLGALAVAELGKLAFFAPGETIGPEAVAALVPEARPSSLWGFLDAVAERRVSEALDRLEGVLAAIPAPLLVNQLHLRLRELIVVADLAGHDPPPQRLLTALRAVNPRGRYGEGRVAVLLRQASRWEPSELEAAIDGLLFLDARAKGLVGGSEAQWRLAVALWLRRLGRSPLPGG
jgi:DNA polymerase III delta subunit